MQIKEIMNKAIAVDHDISIKEAAKIMSDKGIGSLVVVKSGKILGIVTEKDIVDNVSRLDKKISSVMARNVETIEADEEIDNAARLMKENKIKRLPVMDDGKLAGIITVTDLIANSNDLNEDFFF